MEYPRNAAPQNTQEQIAHGLRACALFIDWPEDRLRELAFSSRLQRYRRNTPLVVHKGQHREILVVVSGSIEVATTNTEGAKFILSMVGPGQVTRLVHLLEDVPLLYAYDAREASEVIHIPGGVMRRILDEEPALWRNIAQLMLRRYRLSAEILQDQVLGSTRRRTAIMLVILAHRYGDLEFGAPSTELRISQTDLANMLGVSRQTTSKELARLKDEGILGCGDGYRLIRLLDLPGLLRITQED